MHLFNHKTLFDRIFTNELGIENDPNTQKIRLRNKSALITKSEMRTLKTKIMFRCSLYKNEPIYILIKPDSLKEITENFDQKHFQRSLIGFDSYDDIKEFIDDSSKLVDRRNPKSPSEVKEDQYTQAIFKLIFETIEKFFLIVSLKHLNFTVIDSKTVDFTKMSNNDNKVFGYLMPVTLDIKSNSDTDKRIGERQLDAEILIPIKTLRMLLFFMTGKDIARMEGVSDWIQLLKDLELEFGTSKAFFPFSVSDFFNGLMGTDFRTLITMLLTSGMISYDMLYALSRVIESGTERITGSLSKRIKAEYLKTIQKKKYNKRWITVANYHTLCNVKELVESSKFESSLLGHFKDIFNNIELMITERLFTEKPFSEWVKDMRESGQLHPVFSECSLKNVAMALSSEDEDIIKLFDGKISKRSYQDLIDDLRYMKKLNPTKKEVLDAKQQMINSYAENLFKNKTEKEQALSNWINFNSYRDTNYAFNVIGPVDFSLALMHLDTRVRRPVVNNLYEPAKLFVEDLLTGKIRLSTPYGKKIIDKTSLKVASDIYKMALTGRIILKEAKQVDK